MPVIILGGIYGGIFTPTEAAVVAVVYSVVIGKFVYCLLYTSSRKDIPSIDQHYRVVGDGVDLVIHDGGDIVYGKALSLIHI